MSAHWSKEEIHNIAERGYWLYREGRLQEAAVLFEGVIAVDPEYAYARRAAAAVYLHMRRPEMALRHLDALLTVNPTNIEALTTRCEALLQAGDIDAANLDLQSLDSLATSGASVARLKLFERLRLRG